MEIPIRHRSRAFAPSPAAADLEKVRVRQRTRPVQPGATVPDAPAPVPSPSGTLRRSAAPGGIEVYDGEAFKSHKGDVLLGREVRVGTKIPAPVEVWVYARSTGDFIYRGVCASGQEAQEKFWSKMLYKGKGK